jgi:hypothetical protein
MGTDGQILAPMAANAVVVSRRLLAAFGNGKTGTEGLTSSWVCGKRRRPETGLRPF